MAKVIVERPRIGSRIRGTPKGYRRTLQKSGEDGLPLREGMKRRHQHYHKYLNEHLGPLRRYLDSQVGRPWDKVFSEICAHIDRASAVQDHVRDHVANYVVTQVVLIDGIPYSNTGDWTHGSRLDQTYGSRWYVCPRTGILRRVKRLSRPHRVEPERPDPPRFICVDDSLQCHWIDGAWHLLTMKPLPIHRKVGRERDVVLNRLAALIDPETARKHYGADVYAAGKRRLALRELSQYPIPMDLWT
jgi:hypothetical protein